MIRKTEQARPAYTWLICTIPYRRHRQPATASKPEARSSAVGGRGVTICRAQPIIWRAVIGQSAVVKMQVPQIQFGIKSEIEVIHIESLGLTKPPAPAAVVLVVN